jgi:hypothetical protein
MGSEGGHGALSGSGGGIESHVHRRFGYARCCLILHMSNTLQAVFAGLLLLGPSDTRVLGNRHASSAS